MKKLLLFTLFIGFGTFAFAQFTTNIEVTSFIDPTGVIYIDGDGDGTPVTTIEVTIKNNDAITFPGNGGGGAGSNFTFGVELDGNPLSDPSGGAWLFGLTNDFAPGDVQNFRLTDAWAASTTVGTHELCVSFNLIVNTSGLYTNVDPNMQLCADYTFDMAVGVDDLSGAEISEITMNGDLMTVYVKNSSQQSQIQVMSITGQVVKAVNTAIGGQNFYQNIDVSDLTAGVYIVTVQTENGKASAQKIMIQ